MYTSILLSLASIVISLTCQAADPNSYVDGPTQKVLNTNPPKPILPRPKIKKGEFINIQFKENKKKTVIVPKMEISKNFVPATPAYFQISNINGRLVLNFHSKDPALHLSPSHTLLVQLMTSFPFKIFPSYITNADWAKAQIEGLYLQTRNAKPHSPNRILGKAVFTYCHTQTKVCKQTLHSIKYFFVP